MKSFTGISIDIAIRSTSALLTHTPPPVAQQHSVHPGWHSQRKPLSKSPVSTNFS